jgi:hypothetical protein
VLAFGAISEMPKKVPLGPERGMVVVMSEGRGAVLDAGTASVLENVAN